MQACMLWVHCHRSRAVKALLAATSVAMPVSCCLTRDTGLTMSHGVLAWASDSTLLLATHDPKEIHYASSYAQQDFKT